MLKQGYMREEVVQVIVKDRAGITFAASILDLGVKRQIARTGLLRPGPVIGVASKGTIGLQVEGHLKSARDLTEGKLTLYRDGRKELRVKYGFIEAYHDSRATTIYLETIGDIKEHGVDKAPPPGPEQL